MGASLAPRRREGGGKEVVGAVDDQTTQDRSRVDPQQTKERPGSDPNPDLFSRPRVLIDQSSLILFLIIFFSDLTDDVKRGKTSRHHVQQVKGPKDDRRCNGACERPLRSPFSPSSRSVGGTTERLIVTKQKDGPTQDHVQEKDAEDRFFEDGRHDHHRQNGGH